MALPGAEGLRHWGQTAAGSGLGPGRTCSRRELIHSLSQYSPKCPLASAGTRGMKMNIETQAYLTELRSRPLVRRCNLICPVKGSLWVLGGEETVARVEQDV